MSTSTLTEIYRIAIDLADTTRLPDSVRHLAKRFNADLSSYRSSSYTETELRSDFLNPLFEALGWDVYNKSGNAYSEREVIQEDSVTIDGGQKAPDYAFLTEGKRRFFMEAKRPSVNIASSRAPAYQLKRYCWTAGLPYGLVSDFEEFAIYDCRKPPSPADDPSVGRIAYFSVSELEAYWPLLDAMFGRRNVADGLLDLLASEADAPAGTKPIDTAFLKEIRSWREQLATVIAESNTTLTAPQVNSAVQNLIDRIIFLRIAESRGIEESGALQHAAGASSDIYSQLLSLFRRADDRYNSGLFHFHGPSSDETVDRTAANLRVPDEVLRSIISKLYYPEPYEFSVIPADILGRIYEQFLGERIRVEDDRSITVELKPEFRKSGGVYYTPTPIVEYIVEETLQPLLQGKDPASIRREGFTVLDPASGSGSFLITAYQYLLDWYRGHWATQPKNRERYLEQGSDGQIRVKTSERKRILLDHIFGVDIDAQAVEVTKLSLLLKLIEGQGQLELEIGRILPNLDKNIKCGNSLIDYDFMLPVEATEEEQETYNPFSWEDAFPRVFRDKGFDAVIGNPPYLNVDATWGRNDPRLNYLKHHYPEIYSDKTDLLFYFLMKASQVSRGETGFIVSRSFLEAHKAQRLRGWLSQNLRIRSVLDFRHAQVFPKVGINTAIIRLTHSTAVKRASFSRFTHQKLRAGYDPAYLRNPDCVNTIEVPMKSLDSGNWTFGDSDIERVKAQIDASGEPIGEILHIGQGMQTGANSVFRVDDLPRARVQELIQGGLTYERARNSDIRPYLIRRSGIHLLYPERVENFSELPNDVQELLIERRDQLGARAAYKRGNCEWWKYTWPLHKDYFDRARILCPYRASINRFALDSSRAFLGITDTTVLFDNGQPEDLRYFVGLLNTRILTARFRYIGKLLGGGVVEYYENTVSKLVIPRSKPGDPMHDEIVARVIEAEEAAMILQSSRVSDEIEAGDAALTQATERIEEIAAELYGLSESDRAALYEELDDD